MNLVDALQHLNPTLVVVLISGLLFIEECGLPVPFAPGDLVLVVVGIVMTSGAVSPLLLLVSVTLSMAVGAVAGREIFALVGHRLLARLAEALHFRGSLDQVVARLRRSGWRAVLLGRLTPGLRIHTTQIAGVARVSRLTFITGLLPALAVHIAVFTGLGALVGMPALTLMGRAEHHVLPIAAAIAGISIVAVTARRLAREARLQRNKLEWVRR